MTSFLGPMLAIVWKDVLLELRTKETVISLMVFSLLVVVVFNFAFDPTPPAVALIAPGILWVAFTFAGVLGLTRSFATEMQQDSLHAMMLAPVGREVIFFGKMLSIFLFMMAMELLVFPIFAVLFDISLLQPGLIPVALLATLGIALVGTVFSAMAANTRAREVMLPVLFFPVAMPAILAALEGTDLVISGGGWGGVASTLAFLALFDVIFLVISPVAFAVIVQE